METRNHAPNVVVLREEGQIILPQGVLEHSRLGIGDLLFVVELSEDTIVLKKLDPSKTALDMLQELGVALRAAGYDTREKVDQLVNEIKREVTDEWLARMGLPQGASS